MIICRDWVRPASSKLSYDPLYYCYTGWFLFGLIPLYIRRKNSR